MTFLRALLTVVCAGLFVVAASAQPTQGRRVALVIGNSAYTAQGALANPGPDSRLVADALRRVGFTVTAQNDLGKQAMERALRDFSRSAGGAEVALVYYAGHGLEANGVNWLLPVDAQLVDERDLSFEAISLDTVLGTVERARGLRMVVLDACRNNPFARSMRRSATTRATVTRGLADVEVTGTLVLYAARGGTVAQDGRVGGNSPFAKAFARRLREPGVDVRLMASKVRDDVLAETMNAQEPFQYGSLPGVQLELVSSGSSTDVQGERIAGRLRARDSYIQECTLRLTPALGQVSARSACVDEWQRAEGADLPNVLPSPSVPTAVPASARPVEARLVRVAKLGERSLRAMVQVATTTNETVPYAVLVQCGSLCQRGTARVADWMVLTQSGSVCRAQESSVVNAPTVLSDELARVDTARWKLEPGRPVVVAVDLSCDRPLVAGDQLDVQVGFQLRRGARWSRETFNLQAVSPR